MVQIDTRKERKEAVVELRPTPTLELSVVMPCLNEAGSVGQCVRDTLDTLKQHGIVGEVVVCDNGSTDGSGELAEKAGARVVHEEQRGYGSAYLRAFQEAKGKYIIMADADGTYDFSLIPWFLEPLRQGYDLVMGSRIKGEMAAGTMPILHRYVGVPLLTGFLNVLVGGSVSDAHCGMRAFTREAIDRLNLRTTGMEFASEMIVKAIREKLRIAEVAIPYYPRIGESKLHTFRDGWRHLRYLLLDSPTFLYVIPGLAMIAAGLAALAVLLPGVLHLGSISFDFHYMVLSALVAILGWQVITLGIFAKVFSVMSGVSRADKLISWVMHRFSLEKALVSSTVVAAVGLGILIWVLTAWVQQGFGYKDGIMLRPALVGMTLMVLGVGSWFSSFFLSALLFQHFSTRSSGSKI